MPVKLVPRSDFQYKDWLAEAFAVSQPKRITFRSPWPGFLPDIDPHQLPPNAFASPTTGVIARPGPGGEGEVLMPDAGFTNYDLKDSAVYPLGATTDRDVILIAQFPRTEDDGTIGGQIDKTVMVVTAGDNTTAGSARLWRAKPTDGDWEQVTFGSNNSQQAADEPSADRDNMPDWAVFPPGAPNRSGYSGNINQPVFVFCSPTDPVQVYPVDDAGAGDFDPGEFEPLSSSFGQEFKATTVEAFNGRLYFGDTNESSSRHRQRIRRTAPFTADPLETNVGAGAFDVRDFSGSILRLEKLGNVMAAYFEDGVALVRASNIATNPDAVDVLRERRGLMSTHAVTSIGDQQHFGIFDDGWFLLDPSGRWTEVGLTDINGVLVSKWKEHFYSNLDINNKQLIYVSWDGRYVRIAYPKLGDTNTSDNLSAQEVWIYDPKGDRVFIDRYPVTCWGQADIQVQAATLWSGLVGTWSDQSASWSALAQKFGESALLHGTTTGYVLQHNYDLTTRFDVGTLTDDEPTFQITSPLSSLGDPTSLKTANKLWVELVRTTTSNLALTVKGDTADAGGQTSQIDITEHGNPGDIDTFYATYNYTATNLQYSITGTSPIMLRSFLLDYTEGAEESLG